MSVLTLKAFVIGPIGDKDALNGTEERVAYEEGIQVFEEIIAPACKAFGIEAIRADMISRSGEIPEQIFRHLRDSALVIADLTGANPNVMYELGLRHTTGKVTIQIGERGRLPFDVAAIRTVMFKRTEAGLVHARKDLSKSLAANLDTGGDPVTATRIWFESPKGNPTAAEITETSRLDTIESDDDEAPGFLELLAEMEEGAQSLVQTMVAASSIIQDIGGVYKEAVASVQEADAKGGGAAARLAIANLTASKLDEHAERMAVVAGDYERTVERIEPGITYLLTRLAEEPTQLKDVPDFPSQVRTLVDGARSITVGALGMRDNALAMGKASKSLRKVGQRLAASFKYMAGASQKISDLETLIDRLPITRS